MQIGTYFTGHLISPGSHQPQKSSLNPSGFQSVRNVHFSGHLHEEVFDLQSTTKGYIDTLISRGFKDQGEVIGTALELMAQFHRFNIETREWNNRNPVYVAFERPNGELTYLDFERTEKTNPRAEKVSVTLAFDPEGFRYIKGFAHALDRDWKGLITGGVHLLKSMSDLKVQEPRGKFIFFRSLSPEVGYRFDELDEFYFLRMAHSPPRKDPRFQVQVVQR